MALASLRLLTAPATPMAQRPYARDHAAGGRGLHRDPAARSRSWPLQACPGRPASRAPRFPASGSPSVENRNAGLQLLPAGARVRTQWEWVRRKVLRKGEPSQRKEWGFRFVGAGGGLFGFDLPMKQNDRKAEWTKKLKELKTQSSPLEPLVTMSPHASQPGTAVVSPTGAAHPVSVSSWPFPPPRTRSPAGPSSGLTPQHQLNFTETRLLRDTCISMEVSRRPQC